MATLWPRSSTGLFGDLLGKCDGLELVAGCWNSGGEPHSLGFNKRTTSSATNAADGRNMVETIR